MCYVRSAFACEIILGKFPQRLQNLENVKKKTNLLYSHVCFS